MNFALLDQKLSGNSNMSQLVQNALKPFNLQSAWDVLFVSWTCILHVKKVLYSSEISWVPFYTDFFPWLCFSLLILMKCIPTECKISCCLLQFLHQDVIYT